VEVARQGAGLPTPAIGWGSGPAALVAVTVMCLVGAWCAPRLLRRPTASVGCCLLLALVVLTRPPTPGWPASDWVLAVCDVGQGDALVLRSGPSGGVVVDAGPDPRLVDRCLDRLGVARVPLVVLTHFHDDHVAGLSGVLDGRAVARVEVSPLADPAAGARLGGEAAAAAGLAPVVAPYAVTRRVGDVTLQTVWPVPGALPAPDAVTAGEGSGANDASVVMVAEVAGVRVLLTGDVEPPAQHGLARILPGLEVDVLKVPHHGSSHQDLGFLTGLGARLALIPVGRENGYGHPAPSVVEALERSGAVVRRTDLDGDLLVVVRDGELAVAARGARG
jgi:competence protein ComEC